MAYEASTFDPATEEETGKTREQAEKMLARAKERGAEKLEDTVDLIRRNPGKSIAVATLVGVAVGAVIVNSAMRKSNSEETINELSDIGLEAWKNVKAGAEAAIASASAALCAFQERFSK